jgi:hypothetical protein
LVVRFSGAARRPGSRLSVVLQLTSERLVWKKISKKSEMQKWEKSAGRKNTTLRNPYGEYAARAAFTLREVAEWKRLSL